MPWCLGEIDSGNHCKIRQTVLVSHKCRKDPLSGTASLSRLLDLTWNTPTCTALGWSRPILLNTIACDFEAAEHCAYPNSQGTSQTQDMQCCCYCKPHADTHSCQNTTQQSGEEAWLAKQLQTFSMLGHGYICKVDSRIVCIYDCRYSGGLRFAMQSV